jgi:hypothetical protein
MRQVVIAVMFLTINISAYSQEKLNRPNEIGFVFSNLNSFGLRYKCGNDTTMFRITSLVLTGTNTTNSYNYSNNGVADGNIPASTSNTIAPGLNFGFEQRKWINNKLYFYYGLEWINSYSESKSNNVTPVTSTMIYTLNNVEYVSTIVYNNTSYSKAWTINSGLGIVFGVTYKLNELFSISTEIEPSVPYKYTKTTTSSTGYNVYWTGSSTTGYTGHTCMNSNPIQTVINKGFTYSLSNATASVTIAYRLFRKFKKTN